MHWKLCVLPEIPSKYGTRQFAGEKVLPNVPIICRICTRCRNALAPSTTTTNALGTQARREASTVLHDHNLNLMSSVLEHYRWSMLCRLANHWLAHICAHTQTQIHSHTHTLLIINSSMYLHGYLVHINCVYIPVYVACRLNSLKTWRVTKFRMPYIFEKKKNHEVRNAISKILLKTQLVCQHLIYKCLNTLNVEKGLMLGNVNKHRDRLKRQSNFTVFGQFLWARMCLTNRLVSIASPNHCQLLPNTCEFRFEI